MTPGLLFALALSAGSAWATDDPCKGWTHRPLFRRLPKGAAGHTFSEDRESPYKYSEIRYAHEKLTFGGVGVGVEHFGCEPWGGGRRLRYAFAFKLPPEGPPAEDSGYWLKKSGSLLKALGLCDQREEFPRSWCAQLRLGVAMKPEYRTGGSPEDEGYSISFGFEPGGGEEVLRVLVDRRKDRVVVRLANTFSRHRAGE